MRPIDAYRLKAVLEKNFGHTGGASVLEQLIDEQPTIEPSTNCSEIPNNSDTVSRQAAIDALQKCRKHCIDPFDSYHIDIQDAENQLSKVPTVQPERKKGEWIVHLYKVGVSRYECDACHARCDIIYPYCPYCGEKKEGERDATN